MTAVAGPPRLSTLPYDILLEIAAVVSQAPPELPYQESMLKKSHKLLLCYEPSAALSAFSGLCRACHAASIPYLWQNLRLGSFEHVFDPQVDTSPSAQWTEPLQLDRVEEICECARRVQTARLDIRRRIIRLRWVGLDMSYGYRLLGALPSLQEIRLVPSYMSLRLLPEVTTLPRLLAFPALRYLALDTSQSSLSLLSRCPALECVKLFCYPGAGYGFSYTQFEDMCQGLTNGGSNKTLRILDFAGHSWSARLYLLAAIKLTKLPLEKLEVVNMNHTPLHHPPPLLTDVIYHFIDSFPALRALGLLHVFGATNPHEGPRVNQPTDWKMRTLSWLTAMVEHVWSRQRGHLDYISFALEDDGTVRRLWTADPIRNPSGTPSATIYKARLLQQAVLCGPHFEGGHPGFPLSVDSAWAEFAD
ncbi:hypothetical protein CALVIDRAFT_597253 [Calocera viscosa TUFC12733]|uniref:F-box domain-containing protein n=1 Tax=Calocera viscosa (strain TUFC12733) TaxID=1330018 RepID=A0A167NJ59_CALVF|nr:hypothetical protein CALVIDRAFT_597253 [Calocera viscosa TUFC12733]